MRIYPFWVKHTNRQRQKEKKRAAAAQSIAEKDTRKREIDNCTSALKNTAQEIANRLDLPILITRVAPRSDQPKSYIINYVSDNPRNDWSDFFDLVREISWQYGGRYTLRHVKDTSGNYMTISEWEKVKGAK